MREILLSGLALFGLLSFASALKPGNDVAATYLQNYTKPFATTTNFLLSGNERFKEIGAPWVITGGAGTMGTDCTQWHIDGGKGDALTLTSGWDGFAANVNNMKIYQTITLPAGTYDLKTSSPQDKDGAGSTYLVVDDSIGLPDEAKLGTTALAYTACDKSMTVHFTLTAETKLSIGLVAGANFGEMNCMTIGTFQLIPYEEGTDFTALNALLEKANTMTSANYPTGTSSGNYSAEKWNTFDITRTGVADFLSTNAGNDQITQEEIDNYILLLNTAIDELKASLVFPTANTATSKNWYCIRNAHYPTKVVSANGVTENGGIICEDKDTSTDAEQWCFEYNEDKTGIKIINKAQPTLAIKHMGESAQSQLVPIADASVFTIKTSSGFVIGLNGGDDYGFFHCDGANNLVGWTSDAGASQWAMELGSVTSALKSANAADYSIRVKDGFISIAGVKEFEVYSTVGVKQNIKKALKTGVYFVKVDNSICKVIVK